jgi:uncharacterized iron-regulated membrane protein
MTFNPRRFWRKTHYWGAIACSLPVLVILITGILLMLKKQSHWVQPPTIKTEIRVPTVNFTDILNAVTHVPDAGIKSFSDIERLDIRPNKGVIKVRANNGWEVQLDPQTAQVLQVAYRRSHIIEAIHDGSFFHDQAKLGLFLPASIVLLILWLTGIYLFVLPIIVKNRKRIA